MSIEVPKDADGIGDVGDIPVSELDPNRFRESWDEGLVVSHGDSDNMAVDNSLGAITLLQNPLFPLVLKREDFKTAV